MPPPPWKCLATCGSQERRRRGAERGTCRWRGRQKERKMRLVSQLDEDAACRLIGYTAMWCGVHFYTCCLWVVWAEQLDEWRHCIWLLTCCSTSPRLSGKIRSRASLPPSFHLPLHSPLSFCLLAPLFFYLPAQACIPTLSPATDSFLIFPSSAFMQPKPLLSPLIAFHPSLYLLSLLSPLCLSLYAHICDQIIRAYHGIRKSHGMY